MIKNYFEIFGPPKEEPDYFITHSIKGYEVGNFPNIFQKIFEGIHFTIIKIIPRILISSLIPFLLSDFLKFAGQIVAIPILFAIIIDTFPPSINTLYLINKDDDSDETYNKLLFYSKDSSEGFCVYRKSFVIKSKSKPGLVRLAKTLSNFIELNDYQKIYTAESKKEFNKEYKKSINNA